jgi:hypothetical protein
MLLMARLPQLAMSVRIERVQLEAQSSGEKVVKSRRAAGVISMRVTVLRFWGNLHFGIVIGSKASSCL